MCKFRATRTASEVISSATGHEWERLFAPTSYILGLELLAINALIFYFPQLLKGRNVTFFCDNMNTCSALISGYSKSVVIDGMVKIFWSLAQEIDLNPWFERVGTDYNPADMPTRRVELPRLVDKSINFPELQTLFGLIQQNTTINSQKD